ncbi:hypothetical protein DPMN_065628 [Dreissena polymorpha]|uniref:Uncharacterized protein n=1 Tax=Dreissena polymorpha TaxID=45954 RepID=A0A9D3YSI7_DREPO|nr:hypothetical protein DPMN_065628 [Dreissena polymorpha]
MMLSCLRRCFYSSPNTSLVLADADETDVTEALLEYSAKYVDLDRLENQDARESLYTLERRIPNIMNAKAVTPEEKENKRFF